MGHRVSISIFSHTLCHTSHYYKLLNRVAHGPAKPQTMSWINKVVLTGDNFLKRISGIMLCEVKGQFPSPKKQNNNTLSECSWNVFAFFPTENGQKQRWCGHSWWIHLFLSRGIFMWIYSLDNHSTKSPSLYLCGDEPFLTSCTRCFNRPSLPSSGQNCVPTNTWLTLDNCFLWPAF